MEGQSQTRVLVGRGGKKPHAELKKWPYLKWCNPLTKLILDPDTQENNENWTGLLTAAAAAANTLNTAIRVITLGPPALTPPPASAGPEAATAWSPFGLELSAWPPFPLRCSSPSLPAVSKAVSIGPHIAADTNVIAGFTNAVLDVNGEDLVVGERILELNGSLVETRADLLGARRVVSPRHMLLPRV